LNVFGAGLILMMDRTFDARLNEIIVEKAIRGAAPTGETQMHPMMRLC
jgi:hypothetical protein